MDKNYPTDKMVFGMCYWVIAPNLEVKHAYYSCCEHNLSNPKKKGFFFKCMDDNKELKVRSNCIFNNQHDANLEAETRRNIRRSRKLQTNKPFVYLVYSVTNGNLIFDKIVVSKEFVDPELIRKKMEARFSKTFAVNIIDADDVINDF